MKNKSLYASGVILLVAVGVMNTQYVDSLNVPTITNTDDTSTICDTNGCDTVNLMPMHILEAYEPCATEDSDNCYWDAFERGNGEGVSFYVINGVVTYIK